MLIILCTIHLLATEYIPAQRSRGEVLLFKRGGEKRIERVEDEETGQPAGFTHTIYSETSAHEQTTPVRNTTESHPIKESTGRMEDHAVFHWSNVNYTIKTKNGTRHILSDIEGWVKPGTLTALMVSFLDSSLWSC